jgi:hypothetical protein
MTIVEKDGKKYDVYGNPGSEITIMPVEQSQTIGWRWSSGKEVGYGWALKMLELAEHASANRFTGDDNA